MSRNAVVGGTWGAPATERVVRRICALPVAPTRRGWRSALRADRRLSRAFYGTRIQAADARHHQRRLVESRPSAENCHRYVSPRRRGAKLVDAGPSVLIVGSGPTGATYARLLREAVDNVSVLMVDAGPVVSTPPGTNVKNIANPQEQAAARSASQGDSASGVTGLPSGAVVEGTVTARQGTHLIGRPAEGSEGMPAAAVATCVGGQGAHWTCATPRPVGSERIDFIDAQEWDQHVARAEQLLHVTRTAFSDSPQAEGLLGTVRDGFAPEGIEVRLLPVSGDQRPDGTMRWGGTDLLLSGLTDNDRSGCGPGP